MKIKNYFHKKIFEKIKKFFYSNDENDNCLEE